MSLLKLSDLIDDLNQKDKMSEEKDLGYVGMERVAYLKLIKDREATWYKNPRPGWISKRPALSGYSGTPEEIKTSLVADLMEYQNFKGLPSGYVVHIDGTKTSNPYDTDFFDDWLPLYLEDTFDTAILVKDHKIAYWNDCSLHVYGASNEEAQVIIEHFSHRRRPAMAPQPTVSLLVTSPRGLNIYRMPLETKSFTADNYAPEIKDKFERMLEDCIGDEPKGRIGVISGPPGTGKTFMIMSLIERIRDQATVLLIPSSMVSSIVNPSLTELLLSLRRSGQPTVLVLEDADEAIKKRVGAGDSALSALLNLSDGIFGRVLDTRIICTTNISKDDIDPAIYRPGRLSSYAYIGPLTFSQAQAIYTRIGGEGDLEEGTYTLAQVYAKAAKNET